jgi:hypothetical protein
MSVLTEVHDEISKGVENVKGWISEIEGKMPQAVAAVAKFETSPIVQALETAILPAGVESSIAKLITAAHEAYAAAQASLSADATPAVSTPADGAAPTAG